MAAPPTLPTVALMVPVREDDPAVVDACFSSLAAQDYAGDWTVLVAEGGSPPEVLTAMRAWADRLPGLEIFDNPGRRQSHGCNLLAARARAEVLVRADAHSVYQPDFVSSSVAALLRHDAPAGGPQLPDTDGAGWFTRAVAGAMNARFNLAARFRHAAEAHPVDSVYLGAVRRDEFLELGGYRAFPSGVAEDADFYYRWRKRYGRRPWVDPSIRVGYRPRSTIRGLFRQYFRYGQGKADMFWANGRFPSWRSAVALLAVAWLITGLVLSAGAAAAWWSPWLVLPLAVLLALWLADLLAVAIEARSVAAALAAALMQGAYALGLAWGMVLGPWPVRRALGDR